MQENNKTLFEELTRTVLATGLFQNDLLNQDLLKFLEEDLFVDYRQVNICKAIRALYESEQTITKSAICLYLKDNDICKNTDEQLATEKYLLQLSNQDCNTFKWHRNVKELRDFRFKRQLNPHLQNLVSAYNKNDLNTLASAIEDFYKESRGFRLSKVVEENTVKTLKEVFEDLDRQIREQKEESTEVKFSTGFANADEQINLFKKGSLNTIAARPGMGKTTFAINIIANNLDNVKQVPKIKKDLNASDIINLLEDKEVETEDTNTPAEKQPAIALFSLESKNKDTITNLLAIKSNLPLDVVRDYTDGKQVEPIQKTALDALRKDFELCNVLLNDDPTLNLQSICARIKVCASRYKLRFVIIDHLQLVRPSKPSKEENLNLEIGSASREFKKLALELDTAIIVLSQMNRKIEDRKEKGAVFSDLRDSGGIEQDSDTVMFLTPNADDKNLVNFSIKKNRSGKVGAFTLDFIRAKGIFK